MSPASRPPNILWIMTDQHRADCLGHMGNEVIQTPHLDRLAADGVSFRNAFCQSPVCMGSRASLYTGRYPEAVRVRGMGVLPPSETTIFETLRRQGYQTGAFGKLHITPQKYTHFELGSDIPILDWRRYAADAKFPLIPDDPFKENYGFGTHVGCDDMLKGNFKAWLREKAPELAGVHRGEPLPNGPGDLFVSPYPSEFHETTYIASKAVEYIESRKGAAPWMTFCSFNAPHHPFEAPTDQIDRYDPESIPLPKRKGGVDAERLPSCLEKAVDEIDQYPEDIQRRIVQHYYAAISLIDDAVGSLVDALERTGQRENTIILFVSDHGEMLGDHGLLRKPSVYFDDLIRVPLLVQGPGLAPQKIDGLVELVDVCPTLLGLLGQPVPPGVQGINWAEALRSDGEIGRTDVYTDSFHMDPMVCEKAHGPYCAVRTLRTPEWKLMIYPDADFDASQLFHLATDPEETTNLFHDPSYRNQREQLLFRLLQRAHSNVDPLPLRLRQW